MKLDQALEIQKKLNSQIKCLDNVINTLKAISNCDKRYEIQILDEIKDEISIKSAKIQGQIDKIDIDIELN